MRDSREGGKAGRFVGTPPSSRLAVFLLILSFVACGGGDKRVQPPSPYKEAHWQDVLETMPELLVVVRPKALRRDRVFGPLLRRAFEAARDRTVVVSATPLEVIEDSDEVVVGVRPDEAIVALRGVRADVDPATIVDARGEKLWGPAPGAGSVRELVRADPSAPASLFELPGRTWLIAGGEARARARDVFAHPFGRPPPRIDADALAIVRIDGRSVVSRVWQLGAHGALAAIGRKLQSVTFELRPGAEANVRTTLSYADEDSAAIAEVRARDVAAAFQRKRPAGGIGAMLASATVERPEGKRVIVTAPIPPALVEGLLRADSVQNKDIVDVP